MSMVQGAGLGLRRSMMEQVLQSNERPDFWEIAPENWLKLGGKYAKQLNQIAAEQPLLCHGLSLSIGGPEPLDMTLLQQIRTFMAQHGIEQYSEHLSYCDAAGHLYDLLPIPFTAGAIDHLVSRIHQVQEFLQQPLILENSSYYLMPGAEMSELEFIIEVQRRSGCELLLDVNNAYVNGHNHGYDARAFIAALPSQAIRYLHIAGHLQEDDGLIIDTHGAEVIDSVWQLLAHTYQVHGVKPTLLERDFNIPPYAELLQEYRYLKQLQQQAQELAHAS
ncbi:DUF692 domain-containing protein [Shewanella avicenniae]|uniref:UPF0276 protein JYB87_16570 n=1 Tax=Shewanella avicenniae TaxID=2814294 RepID=A0ABX7QPB5_9GAMM|nr:DUF692 domain-containing protein [Shewanella avicenniae]QSX33317.1 DUF692 domain-containing protein [Shewanella avicenniae]